MKGSNAALGVEVVSVFGGGVPPTVRPAGFLSTAPSLVSGVRRTFQTSDRKTCFFIVLSSLLIGLFHALVQLKFYFLDLK